MVLSTPTINVLPSLFYATQFLTSKKYGVRICILIYAALHKMLFYEVMFCYSIGR